MLKQLEKHIRLMMIVPMTLLILLIGAASIYMNVENAVSNAVEVINRNSVVSNDQKIDGEIRQDEPPKPEGAESKNGKEKRDAEALSEDFGTLYEFTVKEGKLTYQSTDEENAVSAALSLVNGNERNGICKGYFYRLQKTGKSSYNIKLLEDDDLYNRFIRSVLIVAGMTVLGILLLVFLSLAVSKRIVKPVAENEEKQRRFISDTSHELKTPLSVIETSAEMQETETGKTKWLTYIQNETESMSRLISRLLLLSASENKDVDSYTEFDLSSKAELCISTFEALAYEKGVTIISAITPELRFYGSEDDIEHIISPLTDNAIKHTPQGGKVYCALLPERNDIVIRIQNEGEPIPDEDIDRLFDRFYRVDKARNRNEKRYGLGLSIVKAITEKYDGSIHVKCENGLTTFTVKIKNKSNKII